MKSIKLLKQILILVYILNVTSVFAGNWTTLNSGTTADLNDIYFIDSNTGYVLGYTDGVILKTTDGGVNWIPQDIGVNGNYLFEVYFADANNGIVTGGLFEGFISRTGNGGTNWTPLFTDFWMQSIFFRDSDNGYALTGDNDLILRTTDMFNTWDTLTINSTKSLTDICFLSANTGFVVGLDGTILKTIDGGENWHSCLPFSANNYSSIYFPDWETGYVLSGTQCIIEKSTNGGDIWYSQILPNENPLNHACFIDANTGYVVGESGTILKTTNGGETWVSDTSNSENNLNNIYFVEDIGYIVGENGTILKYGGPSLPNEISEIKSNIEIKSYPNPTTGKCEISLIKPFDSDYKIEVFNNIGSLMQTSFHQRSEHSVQIDLSKCPVGLYLIRLKSNRQSFESEIIKQ